MRRVAGGAPTLHPGPIGAASQRGPIFPQRQPRGEAHLDSVKGDVAGRWGRPAAARSAGSARWDVGESVGCTWASGRLVTVQGPPERERCGRQGPAHSPAPCRALAAVIGAVQSIAGCACACGCALLVFWLIGDEMAAGQRREFWAVELYSPTTGTRQQRPARQKRAAHPGRPPSPNSTGVPGESWAQQPALLYSGGSGVRSTCT